MICKQLVVVVCLALIPALVVAESYYLGGCGDFKCYLDPNADNQQGFMTLDMFFDTSVAYMYMWDPSPIESTQTCNSIDVDLTAKTFTYYVNNKANTYTGTAKYTLCPARLELSGNLPDTVLGACVGKAYWYPIYISLTDVVAIACRPSFLGRKETIYMLTNQIYGGLNTTCAAESIYAVLDRKLKYVDNFAGGATMCTA